MAENPIVRASVARDRISHLPCNVVDSLESGGINGQPFHILFSYDHFEKSLCGNYVPKSIINQVSCLFTKGPLSNSHTLIFSWNSSMLAPFLVKPLYWGSNTSNVLSWRSRTGATSFVWLWSLQAFVSGGSLRLDFHVSSKNSLGLSSPLLCLLTLNLKASICLFLNVQCLISCMSGVQHTIKHAFNLKSFQFEGKFQSIDFGNSNMRKFWF